MVCTPASDKRLAHTGIGHHAAAGPALAAAIELWQHTRWHGIIRIRCHAQPLPRNQYPMMLKNFNSATPDPPLVGICDVGKEIILYFTNKTRPKKTAIHGTVQWVRLGTGGDRLEFRVAHLRGIYSYDPTDGLTGVLLNGRHRQVLGNHHPGPARAQPHSDAERAWPDGTLDADE